MNIFISYRRKDEPIAAGRIYTDLSRSFNKENLFKDVDSILPGEKFKDVIFDRISKSQIFLAVIGENWKGLTSQGLLRIFEKEDYVKLEIDSALQSGLIVIPVLIGDCKVPRKEDLPEELQGLVDLQIARLRVDPDWEKDMEGLIKTLHAVIDSNNSKSETELWNHAVKANIIRRYRLYLEKYPEGKYAAIAKEKIAGLRKEFLSPEQPLASNIAKGIPENKMLLIKGGTFIMGNFGNEEESPPHKVELQDFSISRTLVTVGHYKVFCQKNQRSMPAPPSWGWIDDHPMVNVTWREATAYCEWVKGRLPTEAEWEFAANGGAAQETDLIPDNDSCWSALNSDDMTHPVGKLQPNALGLYDMFGNVYEWCNDYYAPYDQGKRINPRGPLRGISKVVRGGSFSTDPDRISTTHRAERFPDERAPDTGFRMVKDIIDPS